MIRERLTASAITAGARLLTAVRGIWHGTQPGPQPRVYFANHRSNGDFVLVWTVLPAWLRQLTRPVAAADYWRVGGIRQFVGEQVFRAVLIERDPERRTEDPVTLMAAALAGGESLIIFPEGTRNLTEQDLLPFKTGIFHLGRTRPGTEFVPVWIANLNRVMPKGEVVPIPLLCTVTFGAPLTLEPGEEKDAFLERSRAALLALSPKRHPA